MGHDPTEHAQEHIQHEAAHGTGAKWITAAALTAAFLAAFAAVSSYVASTHLTQSTLKRIEANDTWMEFDSDSIKKSNITTRDETWALASADQRALIKKQHDADQDKRAEYATLPEAEKEPEHPQGTAGIQKKAISLQEVSAQHLESHETYETSATMFHIAIAVVAISVVAKRKEFWYMSIVGGAVGLYFFGAAFAHAPGEKAEHHEAAAEHAAPGAAEHAAPAGEHSTPPAEHAAPAPTEHK